MNTPQWKRGLQPAGVMARRAGVRAFTAEPTEGRQATASEQLKKSGEKIHRILLFLLVSVFLGNCATANDLRQVHGFQRAARVYKPVSSDSATVVMATQTNTKLARQ